MINKRPTLATGHSLRGLAPIVSVLHADDFAEVYSLGSTENLESLLVLYPNSDQKTLESWWVAQGAAPILKSVELFNVPTANLNVPAAVLEVDGIQVPRLNLWVESDANLRSLFLSIIGAVDRSRLRGTFPDFSPSLTWYAPARGIMLPLLPLPEIVDSEADQVLRAAQAFYSLATGVIPNLHDGSVPSIQNWAKFASDETARIVNRCLQSGDQKAAISTFATLFRALGEEIAINDNDTAANASPAGQGLDKVAGMHALKKLLLDEVVEPVRHPEPYRQYGLSIPNGVLLYGPPGCGKTYIARHLAEELGHYFVEVIPSELASPFIHQSVIRIREMFDLAAEHAPAVVFIDEFEALVPARDDMGGDKKYKSEEVNEFLAHLNKCSERNIFVIAATNQPEKIDAAVRRTGRLDKLIYV